jgi:hypothetical protein
MKALTIALLSVSLLLCLIGLSLQNPEKLKAAQYRAFNRLENMANLKGASAEFKDAVLKARIYQSDAETTRGLGRPLLWLGLGMNLIALIVAMFEWRNRTNQPSALTGDDRTQP